MGREWEKLTLISFSDTAFTQPPPVEKVCRAPHADGLVEELFDSKHWSPCYGKVTDSRGCWTATSSAMENTSGHSWNSTVSSCCLKRVIQTKAERNAVLTHFTCSDPWRVPFLPSFSFSCHFSRGKIFFFQFPLFFHMGGGARGPHTDPVSSCDPGQPLPRCNKVTPLLWPTVSLTSLLRLLIRPEMHHLQRSFCSHLSTGKWREATNRPPTAVKQKQRPVFKETVPSWLCLKWSLASKSSCRSYRWLSRWH